MARKIQRNKKNTGFPKMQLDLVSQFEELLNLNIKHDFFNSGSFPRGKMVLRPTEATRKVLAQNNLQYRSMASGFMLGYSYSDSYTAIREIKKPVHLCFFIEIDDVNFLNYTDLPYEFEEDKMFYFNNRALEKESTDTKNLSLDQFVTEEDKIEISPSQITYTFDDEQDEGTEVQVVNALEEVVFEVELEEGAVACDISLLGEPEGKYSILVDGLEEKSFFLYNGLKAKFGVIDIFIDKDDFGDYTFFRDNGDLIKQEYNIHFGARKVRWQYLLIETGSEKMNDEHEAYDSTKVNGVEPTSFEAVEQGELESGQEVHTIWTTNEIPFREKQRQKFKLKTKRGKSGVDWIVELPCASALANLKVNLLDNSEVYSEIIVYL